MPLPLRPPRCPLDVPSPFRGSARLPCPGQAGEIKDLKPSCLRNQKNVKVLLSNKLHTSDRLLCVQTGRKQGRV